MNEPGWTNDDGQDTYIRPPRRSADEERVLTELARNYLMGRRVVCKFTHMCIGLGVAVGAFATWWDHIASAGARVRQIVSGH